MNQPLLQTTRLTAVLLTVTLFISACQEEKQSTVTPATKTTSAEVVQHPTPVADSSPIMATVNGEAITEADIEFTINKTFNSAELMLANQSIKDKVLQSLIASRAMKYSMQQTMDSDDLQSIQQKVSAYEEELYIKAYLRANAEPQPVTTEMVKTWYQQNPQRYGGSTIKEFELLKTVTELSEEQRNKLLSSVSTIKQTQDWSSNSQQWQDEYQLIYQKAQAVPGLLDKSLQQALDKLQQDQTSDIILQKGDIYLLRVTHIKRLPPRSLSEVSADIRKTLAPLQLKKAVKKASKEAIKQAAVEYVK